LQNPTSYNPVHALVWAPEEVRTELYANKLGATLHHVHFFQYKRPLYAPFKYPLQWLKTWQILFSQRPKYVYVTNPPIIAGLCVYFYCLVTGAKMVMDTHSPALYSQKWGWTVPLQRWVAQRAMMNIVDQDRFKRLFEGWGAKAIILEKPPKGALAVFDLSKLTKNPDTGKYEVAVVNTFAEDEPLQPILDAAKQLPDCQFHITGNLKKADPEMVKTAPPNCRFTGYLRGLDYWNLLYNTRVTIVLTTFEYSLLGGAQDAAVLHKPTIVSDQPALREYFTQGTVFAANTADGLAAAIKEVQQREADLITDTAALLEERQVKWDQNFSTLLKLIGKG
jgi:glycosyltransferase involved in cell wall biosynthesis